MNRFMRILVMFDLPTKTRLQRKTAAQFRRFLLKDGYFMVQYSVYARVCAGMDSVNTHLNRLEVNKPANGCARALVLTERQYERMVILLGDRIPDEELTADEQLTVF